MAGTVGVKRFFAGMMAALVVASAGMATAQEVVPAPAPVEGVWRTQLLAEVTIAPCPEGYCGTLSHIVVPEGMLSGAEAEAAAAMTQEEFFDVRNEDPALRSRPMLGLQIMTMAPGDKPHIFDGEIYNPEDGKTYSGYLEVLGPDMLRLNGCVLFNVICRGEDWTRVPAEELEARLRTEAAADTASAQ